MTPKPLWSEVVFVLGSLAVACGSSTGQPTIQGDHYQEVAAPAPSAPSYATLAPSGAVVRGATLTAQIEASVQAAAQAHEMPLEGDPRLGQLAEWVAERLGPDGDPPPNEVVEFFTRTLGLVEPVPHIMVLGQPAEGIAEGVRDSVGQFMERQVYNRFGAAVVERANLTLVVVTLSWRWLDLEAIPRQASPGSALTVRGELRAEHRNPTIAVASPDGEIRRIPAGGGPAFDVRVPVEQPGTYQVEVLARGPHGDTVLANFPVYVGEEIPHAVRVSRVAESAGRDVETVRRELLDMINETRAQAGLEPLRSNAQVQAIALAHSRDMVEHEFIGHDSPRTGSPADRVRSGQLHSGLVLENIGRGYSASEIHRGLLDSPGHRANLVNPDVTHVGIGVIAEPEGERSAFVVTEVFIRMAEEVDLSSAATQVAQLINRARSARGAPPVSLEDPLSEAAQHAAEEFFRDPDLTQRDTVDDASASLRRFAIAYRRIGGVMAVVTDVSEAGALEPTLETGIRFIGVGAAQGTRPDTGPNAIAVVIVMAWPR